MNIARQVAGEGVLHDATDAQVAAIVAQSRTMVYFVQRFEQLVSQWFFALYGMLHAAILQATCLAMALRDKLLAKLQRVTLA